MSSLSAGHGQIALGDLMARLSAHLGQLNAQLEGIEMSLAAQSRPLEGLGESPLIKLQGLDHLRQALADLTVITAHLAGGGHAAHVPVPAPDALDHQLMLKASRDLLWQAPPAERHADPLAHGDLDLF